MRDYYYGGGPMVTPQGRAITKMKREDPEAYRELMQPARRWVAWLITIMLGLSVAWAVICAVVPSHP